MRENKKENGFIALMTAIVLSFILMITAVALNQTSFFARSEILDAEYKNRSSALAEACVDTALLKLAVNPGYAGPDPDIPVGSDTCDIRPVITTGSQKIIQTRAEFQEAATNLEVKVDASDLSVVSWNECAWFPCP